MFMRNAARNVEVSKEYKYRHYATKNIFIILMFKIFIALLAQLINNQPHITLHCKTQKIAKILNRIVYL